MSPQQPTPQPYVQLPPLDVGTVNLILEGLSMLPLGRSLQAFSLVQAEAQRQLQPQAPAPGGEGQETKP